MPPELEIAAVLHGGDDGDGRADVRYGVVTGCERAGGGSLVFFLTLAQRSPGGCGHAGGQLLAAPHIPQNTLAQL